ncbi:MAG: sensor histidine kinase [Actinocatenispora sp.]
MAKGEMSAPAIVVRLGVMTAVAVALCGVAAALTVAGPGADDGPPRWRTVGLVVALVGWLLVLCRLTPRWRDRRPLRLSYYLVLLGLVAALIADSPWFMLVSWLVFVDAFLLFEARWAFGAAAASGVLLTVAQSGSMVPTSRGSVPLFLLSMVLPLLVAGWYLGRESESRRRLNAELATANRALAGALAANAALEDRIVRQARESGVQQERQRVAREIHDTLAQSLSAINTQLTVVLGAATGTETWTGRVTRVRDLARDGLTEARRSVGALTPYPLVGTALPGALSRLAREWAERTDITVDVDSDTDVPALPDATEAALYRVTQSALANVAEHSGARRVRITLAHLDDEVVLDVCDDGVGFDPARPPDRRVDRGFGLAAMRQRVAEVRGRLDVESTPGAGTALRAAVPLTGGSR